ncbi:DUF6917 domain-containing protein [Paenibacillus pasadenensis]|uniref:DUF6917 domain-containing protein n=1 Tax=Paenibacillus pasadenensis TaxID=217090 RepID=A0A2N5N2Y1_9BACL|nr:MULTISPECIES: hypothetical protein [Paenibacillus]PLT44691.1 hypothetical protein B8V81_3122 [Paenibacillus pasadenensis]
MRLADKRIVRGRMVKLLHHKRMDRGMRLMEERARCIRQGDIHELVTTTQASAAAGDAIDRVGFLGFAEFEAGGVIQRGDRLVAGGRLLGEVLGFDDCHFPNHYNILIAADELLASGDVLLEVEQAIRFEPGEEIGD